MKNIFLIVIFFIIISGCKRDPFYEGVDYYKNRDYERAITSFLKALKAEKNPQKCRYYIAISYHKLGEFKKAIKFYTEFINNATNDEKGKKVIDTIKELADKARLSLVFKLGKEDKLDEAFKVLSGFYKLDYPAPFYMGIIFRKRGEYLKSINSFLTAFNISNKRSDNNKFICELHWEMAKTYHEKFKKTQDITDYYKYIRELRLAFFLRHPDKEKWKQLAQEFSLLQEDPIFIKQYGSIRDAYNRIGRGFTNGNISEIEENAEYLIKNAPIDEDKMYGYISLAKLYLEYKKKPMEALKYYKKAREILEGTFDSIPLRIYEGLGEKIRQEIEGEKNEK